MDELKIVREKREGYGALTQVRVGRDVFEAFRDRFAQADREEFLVLLLDGKNQVLGFNVVSVGTLMSSLTHPREIFKAAILGNAASLILLHNHLSGDPAPSAEDLSITKRLKEVGELLGIPVLDHIIIGDGRYVSFIEAGFF